MHRFGVTGLVFVFVLTGVLFVLTPSLAAAQAPYYRVFRGQRLATVSPEEFPKVLSEVFIPAAPRTHASNGLVAYVPALPGLSTPPGTPDEIAIVVYESEAVYQAAAATPEGRAYSALHGTVFDMAASKSGGARPMARPLEADVPVDVLARPVDWQTGQAFAFVGARSDAIAPELFLSLLTSHVVHARDAFRSRGLDGYIVVATPDREIAWMHWTSPEAMNAAVASAEGARVIKEAGTLMKTVLWAPAAPFTGAISYGHAVNVLFTRRTPPPASSAH